ncbi:type I-E CRISPR-associated protein Cse1/CasA [Quadrisphaera sp. DSM 44207]|uniref:type I-E CRISPR-associated protein Cse1/CasA n=1 Tax=Quadrisphaera sp. DSM 44207 TaxID=1881057 RepID=UPI000890350F|nr:type I-E CRISPR-associated protein Cse1/CasA [Quadrisphaera sp. DSM 44207]SDQ52613.1 CRISPR-associated protein, Cse1 family [Quadrisphaera sp. DSM 44207]
MSHATADGTTFDLRTQPWLLVRTLAGDLEGVSLLDAFVRARELQGLTGEVPTQGVALYRLLLALLHRAVPWDRDDPVAHWAAAWNGEVDLAEHVRAHLEGHAERFDLLSPTTPFFQVADLRTAKDGASGLTSLIADVPNNAQYFTTRAGRSLRSIGLAEAARWLVHAQAFDPSGIKSGAVGDPRVKGGKGYPIGTGWSGQLGGLLVEGADLLETLLLNLVLVDRDEQPWSASDTAVWERAPHGPAVEAEGRHPGGPADLLTWQSRRIRLLRDGDAVTGVLIANGDPLRPQNQHLLETMTAWRRSEAQERTVKKSPVYMPRTHQPERALWRGLPALLPQTERGGTPGDASRDLAPAVLDWLALLRDKEHLSDRYSVRTRAIGVRYGSNSSVIDEIVDDALLVHAVLLGHEGRELRRAAIDAVGAADAAALALANLAGNLAAAAGGEPEGPRDRAREQAYFVLDAPYRLWLASLEPSVDPQQRREAWERFVWHAVRVIGDELLADAGSPAWVGREVRGHHVTSALAEAWFLAALRRALVLAAGPSSAHADAAGDEIVEERSTR